MIFEARFRPNLREREQFVSHHVNIWTKRNKNGQKGTLLMCLKNNNYFCGNF